MQSLHSSKRMNRLEIFWNERKCLLHLIEELAFGRIEQLSIRNGEPCYECAPRIVQEIKLGSETERRPDRSKPDLTLKKEKTDATITLSLGTLLEFLDRCSSHAPISTKANHSCDPSTGTRATQASSPPYEYGAEMGGSPKPTRSDPGYLRAGKSMRTCRTRSR